MLPKRKSARSVEHRTYTPEEKALIVHVARACEAEATTSHAKKKAASPLERAASLTTVPRQTIGRWLTAAGNDDEPPLDERGGDRRSVEALDPAAASEAAVVVRRVLAERHLNGQAATAALVLGALQEVDSLRDFFANDRAVRRFMERQGFTWRKSDPYEFLKHQPRVARLRDAYIFKLVQNRFAQPNCSSSFTWLMCVRAAIVGVFHDCRKFMWMRPTFGNTTRGSGRGSLTTNSMPPSRRKHLAATGGA